MRLPDEAAQLIDRPNFAHLATLLPDGSPQCAPVWVGREGDRLLVGTGEGTIKARNTRRDARVALSLVDQENPYWEAQVRGRVVERQGDESLAGMDALADKYTSAPFPWRAGAGRILLVIEVDRVRCTRLPFAHKPRAG